MEATQRLIRSIHENGGVYLASPDEVIYATFGHSVPSWMLSEFNEAARECGSSHGYGNAMFSTPDGLDSFELEFCEWDTTSKIYHTHKQV